MNPQDAAALRAWLDAAAPAAERLDRIALLAIGEELDRWLAHDPAQGGDRDALPPPAPGSNPDAEHAARQRSALESACVLLIERSFAQIERLLATELRGLERDVAQVRREAAKSADPLVEVQPRLDELEHGFRARTEQTVLEIAAELEQSIATELAPFLAAETQADDAPRTAWQSGALAGLTATGLNWQLRTLRIPGWTDPGSLFAGAAGAATGAVLARLVRTVGPAYPLGWAVLLAALGAIAAGAATGLLRRRPALRMQNLWLEDDTARALREFGRDAFGRIEAARRQAIEDVGRFLAGLAAAPEGARAPAAEPTLRKRVGAILAALAGLRPGPSSSSSEDMPS